MNIKDFIEFNEGYTPHTIGEYTNFVAALEECGYKLRYHEEGAKAVYVNDSNEVFCLFLDTLNI